MTGMKRWTAVLLLGLGLGLAACSGPQAPDGTAQSTQAAPAEGTASGGATSGDTAPGATVSGTAVSDAAPSGVARPKLVSAPVNEHFDALVGKPCAAPGSAGETCRLCDKHDRIVGVVLPGDFVHLDTDTDVLRRSPEMTQPRQLTFVMAAGAETLRAQVLTCPGCRRLMGWAVVVSMAGLRDLDAGLRGELQAALGWPATPLLGDAAGFKAAVATDPVGTGLACPGGVRR